MMKDPLQLALGTSFVTVGLVALAIAANVRGALVVIPLALGGAAITSVFLGVPATIVSYVRSRRGPGYEAFFAIAVPFVMTITMVWLTSVSFEVVTVLGLRHWNDYAFPVVSVLTALLNTGTLIFNVISTFQRRRGP
jgi:ABC-type dipeptide/oligopeptide/nickel transport system permease component